MAWRKILLVGGSVLGIMSPAVGQEGVSFQPGAGGGQQRPAGGKDVASAIPLTPDIIRDLGRRFGENRRAQEEALTEIASPESRRVNVSFVPGAAVPIIHTVKGYPTAIAFFDKTGEPWPILWDTNSNPAAVAEGSNCNAGPHAGGPAVAAVGFYVCTPVKGSNVLEITPMSLKPRGGLVVTLENAPKPLSFMLIGGGERYDADLTIQTAESGPKAKTQTLYPSAPDTAAPFLTAMLDGVPPAEAVPLSVSGVSPEDLRAWKLGEHVYLRTRLTLISPEWVGSENGEGGLTVYEVPSTPVVLLSHGGRTVSAALKED